MAVVKLLNVQTGPTTPDIDKLIALSWNKPRGSFHGSGDSAMALHVGRQGFVTGTVTVEDITTAESVRAAAVAEAAFTVADDTGTATVTFTDFCAAGNELTLGDGIAVGAPIAGIGIPFVASAVAIT